MVCDIAVFVRRLSGIIANVQQEYDVDDADAFGGLLVQRVEKGSLV
jgi:hypothetical protein